MSSFGELVARGGGFDPAAGKLLASLFDRRNQADYATSVVPEDRAQMAIADAARFVDAVDAWVRGRPENPER